MRKGEDVFTIEQRVSYEMISVALGVYQLVDNKVKTLLVSDGLCEMVGIDRVDLIQLFDTDMFRNVHPDDVERLAQIGYRFSREEGVYDIVYRTKLYGKNEYRLVHTVGKFQRLTTGSRVAFLVYTDVTDLKKNELNNSQEINDPKVNFFYEHMGPMAVIAQKNGRLLYFNQAVSRIIPPRVNYDSGITFQQFFFPDFSDGIKGLTDAVNGGTRVVEEPYTKRHLELSVIASTWNKERAYVIYFYEIESDNPDIAVETTLRHRRMAFNNVMFTGKQDGFSYSGNSYQNFRIWNLSRNEIVYYEEHMEFAFQSRDENAYDDYIAILKTLCHEIDDKEFLEICNRKRMLLLFQSAAYPKTRILSLNTKHGILYISLEFIMMQSPDTGDIYIKVWEENITDKEITRNLAKKAVEQEYDFIAYMDILADRCWIINGKTSGIRDKRPYIKISDYSQSEEFLQNVEEIIDKEFVHIEDLIQYIVENLNEENIYEKTRQMSCGRVKNLQIQSVDIHGKILYFRSRDVTQVLLKEKERERELEGAKNEALEANEHLKQAVLNERKKVEAILMQTVLAVSKALDAKDPYTCQHSERVAKYASEIARKLNWSNKKVNEIYNISLVHDIGKMGIPDALLMKSSSLTIAEYEIIKKHVVTGSNILKDFTAIENIYEGILYHHERYDGCGYVYGLVGENIPIEARIICVADSVDAMYSTRPYREKQSVEFIIKELILGKGKQFDPRIVDVMLELIESGMLEVDNDKPCIFREVKLYK